MQDVFDGLERDWRRRVLIQGNLSKQETLNKHKARVDEGEPSVLFGLASFAEGVDLPGAYCEHVVIAKIPFAVPDDPVEAALAEWIEARGGNPFMEIAVPDASLRLVQACGRLLRTEQDRGTITLLDRRVVTQRYGKAISMPCRHSGGTSADRAGSRAAIAVHHGIGCRFPCRAALARIARNQT